MILLFVPSIFQSCAFLAGTLLPESEFVSNILPYSLVSTCSGLQQFSNCGPSLCLASPEHFLHQINVSPCLSTLLTKSWPPKYVFLPFSQKMLTNTSAPYTILASSCTCYSFHASYIDTCWHGHTIRCDVSSLLFSHPLIHLSVGFGLSSSQSFQSSTKL